MKQKDLIQFGKSVSVVVFGVLGAGYLIYLLRDDIEMVNDASKGFK